MPRNCIRKKNKKKNRRKERDNMKRNWKEKRETKRRRTKEEAEAAAVAAAVAAVAAAAVAAVAVAAAEPDQATEQVVSRGAVVSRAFEANAAEPADLAAEATTDNENLRTKAEKFIATILDSFEDGTEEMNSLFKSRETM